MVKYTTHDKTAIADPASVVERLLASKDDDCHLLAITECYDLDDGDEPLFQDAMKVVDGDFDRVVAALTNSLGAPTFIGDDANKKFPLWAGTGHRVAFWKKAKRIVYVHITHAGSVAPLELNLGVVTGPPKNWVVGD